MDSKLAEYRAKKRKETRLQAVKNFFSKPFNSRTQDESQNLVKTDEALQKCPADSIPYVENLQFTETFNSAQDQDSETLAQDRTRLLNDRTLVHLEITIKVILWFLLLALFVVLEFGAVFVVFSIFYIMFTNFRSTPKRDGEMSAYSVFNPNCEAIDGTLTAKQFEKELVYGATAIH